MAEFIGRHVKITLENNEQFEGYVRSMNQTTSKLTLEKVTDCISNTKLKGLQHFFRSEIQNVEATEDQIIHKTQENDTIIQERREKGPSVLHSKYAPSHLEKLKTFQPPQRMLKAMSSLDEDHQQESKSALKSSDYDSSSDQELGQADEYTVISKIDQKFHQAVHHITRYAVIGVAVEGVCIGRTGTLCWLQVATKDDIFLFDVLTMGPDCFTEGLKDLLENANILKVMHDCRLPSDMLHHVYGVSLVNIFDTQVAQVFVYRLYHGGDWPRYVQGLPACLFEHLDLGQEQIHMMKVRNTLKKEDQEVWKTRPSSRALLQAAAKDVKHLRDLRLILTEKMMAEFVAGVDVYLSHVKNASKDDALRHQANPQLLPLGFRDLDGIMIRSKDIHWLKREQNLPKGPSGFQENCTGIGDPDVVFSHDSIWHTGDNRNHRKGSKYFRQFQNLLSKNTKSSDGASASKEVDTTENMSYKNKNSPENEEQEQNAENQIPVRNQYIDIAKPRVDVDLPLTDGSTEQKAGDCENTSGKMTAGSLMRQIMSEDKFFNTGEDSLENIVIRPAGCQITKYKKRGNKQTDTSGSGSHQKSPNNSYAGSYHKSPSFSDNGSFHKSPSFSDTGSFHKSPSFSDTGSFHKSPGYSNNGSFHKSSSFSDTGSFHKSSSFSDVGLFQESQRFSENELFQEYLSFPHAGSFQKPTGFSDQVSNNKSPSTSSTLSPDSDKYSKSPKHSTSLGTSVSPNFIASFCVGRGRSLGSIKDGSSLELRPGYLQNTRMDGNTNDMNMSTKNSQMMTSQRSEVSEKFDSSDHDFKKTNDRLAILKHLVEAAKASK